MKYTWLPPLKEQKLTVVNLHLEKYLQSELGNVTLGLLSLSDWELELGYLPSHHTVC